MNKIEENKLDKISGGTTTFNGPIINALSTIITLLQEAGYNIGSGIRRITEGDICPLK